MDFYLSATGETTHEIVIQRSRFICTLKRIDGFDDALSFVKSVKKKYSDATHNCYAFISNAAGTEQRFSDDGEPQGTAGQPMLNVFQREGVTNAVCVVTRYFGGILLGAGGLTRAYSKGARDALAAGTLYVLEDEGRVTAAAKIDQHQMAQYAQCAWRNDAPPEQVLVLHTLVVDPAVKGRGYGTAFVRFYEALGRETGRNCLRIDTNARNTPARVLYARLGYTEAGIVAGTFNGIPGVQLVCLEKTV